MLDCVSDGMLIVKVKPNASATKVVSYSPLKIAVKAVPENGKANVELIRFLTKELKKSVRLVKGATSRTKVFKVG